MAEETEVEVTSDDNSFLEMSDEDIMNYDPSLLEDKEEELDEPEEADETEDDDAEDSTEDESDDSEGETEGSDSTVDVEDEVTDSKEEVTTTDTIDYKAEYERLTQSFKANGKEIAVANVDEAISLMQMGANYNKKMAALKPNLKLLKLLENNKLLD